MTAADLLIKYLEEVGVRYIFGIPGGALEPLYAAINRSKKIEAVLAKHEQGAAFMADGYARASRKIGVCCATTGPGSTNLITGVASSFADSVPVFVITAQVPISVFGKGALQESTCDGVNIVDIFRFFTKFSAMVINPAKMGEMIRQALRFALSGRKGPVHLNVPMDVMRGKVYERTMPIGKFVPDTTYFDRTSIKKAATLLLYAQRPGMLVGNGSLISGAVDEIAKFAELLSIPVATTPKAKGAFPENNPLSLGVFGLAGSPLADSYLLGGKTGNNLRKRRNSAKRKGKVDSSEAGFLDGSKVDVLLSIGTSFSEWGTHAWDKRLMPEKAMIQMDIDPHELGKNYPFEVELMGDAKTIVKELTFEVLRQIELMTKKQLDDFGKRMQLTMGKINHNNKSARRHLNEETMKSEEMPLKPQRLMKDLRDSVPEDTLFFVDIGNNLIWATHYFDIVKPYTFFAALGFASMGFGAAAAVGGKFAEPDKTVVAIVGDGGFFMNGIEVATSVNYDRQVIWIVENNSELGMVSHSRKLLSVPYNIGATFKQADFVKIAEGLGAVGIKVTKPGEINKEMMSDIIATGKSTVIDVIIDKDEIPPLYSRVNAIKEDYF